MNSDEKNEKISEMIAKVLLLIAAELLLIVGGLIGLAGFGLYTWMTGA